MRMVKNDEKHWEFIRQTRNHTENVEGFISQRYITVAEHTKYMEENNDGYWLCLGDDGDPMGYIGLISNDIRVATHPNFKGKGVATFMVNWLATYFPRSQAKVKVTNEASRKLFEKCGFEIKYYLMEKK